MFLCLMLTFSLNRRPAERLLKKQRPRQRPRKKRGARLRRLSEDGKRRKLSKVFGSGVCCVFFSLVLTITPITARRKAAAEAAAQAAAEERERLEREEVCCWT